MAGCGVLVLPMQFCGCARLGLHRAQQHSTAQHSADMALPCCDHPHSTCSSRSACALAAVRLACVPALPQPLAGVAPTRSRSNGWFRTWHVLQDGQVQGQSQAVYGVHTMQGRTLLLRAAQGRWPLVALVT